MNWRRSDHSAQLCRLLMFTSIFSHYSHSRLLAAMLKQQQIVGSSIFQQHNYQRYFSLLKFFRRIFALFVFDGYWRRLFTSCTFCIKLDEAVSRGQVFYEYFEIIRWENSLTQAMENQENRSENACTKRRQSCKQLWENLINKTLSTEMWKQFHRIYSTLNSIRRRTSIEKHNWNEYIYSVVYN